MVGQKGHSVAGGGVLGEREREGGLEGPVGERLEAAQ